MISALVGGAVGLVRKPALIVPGIIAGLLVTIAFFLFFETTLFFMLDLVASPDSIAGAGSIFSVPYVIFASYPLEVLSTLAFIFLIIATNIWVLQAFAIAESQGGRSTVTSVVAGAVSRLGRIVFTALTVMCLVLLYAVFTFAYFAVVDVLGFVPFLPVLLVLLWLVLSAYLYLKLLFFGTVSVSDEKIRGKEILLRTWKWSNRKLLGILVFMVLAAVISNFILGIGFTASDFVDEFIGYLVIMLFYALSTAYSSFAFVKYYFHSKDSA